MNNQTTKTVINIAADLDALTALTKTTKLTYRESKTLQTLLNDDKAAKVEPVVYKQTATLSLTTYALIKELELLDEDTIDFRFLRMACRKNAVVPCETKTDDVKGYDVITLTFASNKIEIALPIYFQNKLATKSRREIEKFKATFSCQKEFAAVRKFYRDLDAIDEAGNLDAERPVDYIFDVAIDTSNKKA
jgi:hypothetical protein